MRPENDPSWPTCDEPTHVPTAGTVIRHWCIPTRDVLMETKDAGQIVPGLRYCVPVVPTMDLYAEVSINSETYAGGKAAMMALVRDTGQTPDPFGLTTAEEFISLGMWTKGEGRFVMSTAIWAWVDVNEPEKCTAPTHAFAEEMTLQATLKQTDTEAPRANRWTLAFYNQCIVCFGKLGGAPSLPTFDPADFGLGPDNFKPDRGPSGSGGASWQGSVNVPPPPQTAADRTRGLLQARYGNGR